MNLISVLVKKITCDYVDKVDKSSIKLLYILFKNFIFRCSKINFKQ